MNVLTISASKTATTPTGEILLIKEVDERVRRAAACVVEKMPGPTLAVFAVNVQPLIARVPE